MQLSNIVNTSCSPSTVIYLCILDERSMRPAARDLLAPHFGTRRFYFVIARLHRNNCRMLESLILINVFA